MGTRLGGVRLFFRGYKYGMAATAFEEQMGHVTHDARHGKQAFFGRDERQRHWYRP